MPKHEDLVAAPPSGGSAPLSDAEVICTWMEPKPPLKGEVYPGLRSDYGWWVLQYEPNRALFGPRRLTLDALREVQERLTDEQWEVYRDRLQLLAPKEWHYMKRLAHADAPTRIKCLAAILRPLVTEARGPDGPRASNAADAALSLYDLHGTNERKDT